MLMRQGNLRESNETWFVAFSLGAAFATAACALGGALNIAAHSPLPPLIIAEISGGMLCLATLTKWAQTLGYCWGQRFAGSLLGLTLSAGAAIMSQSLDLSPRMELPPPYFELSATSAEILYGKPHPVTPIPVHSRPRSFLSHTHEPAAWSRAP